MSADEGLGLRHDVLDRDAVDGEQPLIRGGLAELILNADALDLALTELGGNLADGGAEAVHDIVILDGDDLSDLIDAGCHACRIQRLDGVHVNRARLDALGRENLGRLDGETHGVAVGEDGHVLALAEGVRLADDKFGVLIIDDGHLIARKAQVHGAVPIGGGAHELARGVIVRRHDDGHVGDGAVDAHVLDRLMARAVVRGGDAAVRAGELHIEVRVGGLLADHLAHAHGAEGGVGHDEGDLPAGGETCRDARAVLLRDADVQVLRRKLLAEGAGLAAFADVRVDDEDVGILLAHFDDLVAEAVAGRNHFFIFHFSALHGVDVLAVQLVHGLMILLLVRGDAVPADLVFHKAHAVALDGLADDALGQTVLRRHRLIERVDHLLHAVAVDLEGLKAEGLKLSGKAAEGHDLVAGAVELEVVPVDEDDEVVEPVLMRGAAGLPNLALVRLAVAEGAEDVVAFAVELRGERHACGAGEALSEGAGGDVDAGALVHAGVALQRRALFAQGVQHAHVEIALHGEGGILRGAGVALGEDEAVAVFPAGIFRVDVHGVPVAGGDEIRHGERAAGMTGLRLVDHVDDVFLQIDTLVFQLCNREIVFHTLCLLSW